MRAARSNTMDNFRLIFEDVFLQKGIECMSSNERLLIHILNHPEAQRMLMAYMLPEVYRKLREGIPQEQESDERDPES